MNTPGQAPDAAVLATDLSRRFGTVTALEAVSFRIEHGELYGFIGPDGAGKTTLFRILVSLLRPDDGTATVLGLDVGTDYRALRTRVGYMPGRFSLYPDLSVEENLRFFAFVFGTTIAEGYETIAPIYTQIEPFKKRRAGALSGGMKQKLALSCALIHRPDILFLDEPTTGVDAVSRREFWEMLTHLRASGLTLVVSTAYMDEADRCDRVALIQDGRLLAIDAPRAIGARYGYPLLAVRVADRYRALQMLRHAEHARAVLPFGDVLHYTDARRSAEPVELAAELQARLRREGFTDAQVQPIAANIEDAFMALMGRTPAGEAEDTS